jgi:hypothetical protein
MERWTFLIIPAADGSASQIRMILRSGDDADAWPTLQVGLDGVEVPVDDVEKDYEAPEWKAKELFTGGGGTEPGWEQLKNSLRDQVVS